jgi:hypothetical protein
MKQSLQILAELEAATQDKLRPIYIRAITASLRGEDAEPYWERFRTVFIRAYVLADIIGRLGVANEARTLGRRLPYAEPMVTGSWDAAIAQFMTKLPMARQLVDRLLPVAKKKAFWVTGIESTEALSKIQERIAERLSGELVEDTSGFVHGVQAEFAEQLSTARLETVMRTNVMTALNEGAMEEQKTLGDSVALLRLNEVHDHRTRGAPGTNNPGKHWQMDGFVESPNHSIWQKITPPNGYQCRGNVSVIGWASAERLGFARDGGLIQSRLDEHNAARWEIINAGEYPDAGFQ